MMSNLRYFALLVFVLATYFSSTLARHHAIRHARHRRQHHRDSGGGHHLSDDQEKPEYPHSPSLGHHPYHPSSFVLEDSGGGDGVERGNWGPWSQPSQCSRSCGGGVAYQTRVCRERSPDGQDLCTGGNKRFFSCNIQDCESTIDYRSEQCAEFNTVPFEGRYYQWVPYTKAPNKCELNCMPRAERFYQRLRRKVVDGTRCAEEYLDVCVDGKCLPVGCDRMLGSKAREDRCRECGGDDSGCNTVQGTIDSDDMLAGYNDIILIPSGATNIQIREVQPSSNYLALRNESGHYYLNGRWRIDFPRSLRFVGTVWHYERKTHVFDSEEAISALGPTTEPIYVVLLYQERNPGVHYEYSVPRRVSQQTDPDSYSWLPGEFSECSATCGGGVRYREVFCARRKDAEPATENLCEPSLKPPDQEACAPDPCPSQWSVGNWTPCSEPCGPQGVQIRQVHCEQIIPPGRATVLEDSVCLESLGPKPTTSQSCNQDAPCPAWHIGPWKPCDHLCGEGVQKRQVRCFRKDESGKIEVLPDVDCRTEKAEDTKPCQIKPCEGTDWILSEWSGCENKCGPSFETRRAQCANEKGKIYPNSSCPEYSSPELQRPCETPPDCEFQWYTTQWSKCSAKCGEGVKTRKVFCGIFEDDAVKKVDDSKCEQNEKYESSKPCQAAETCKGEWFTGPWSECTKKCGGGSTSRKIVCLKDNKTATDCDANEIPFGSESCNIHSCTEDQLLPMSTTKSIDDYDEEEECEEDEEEEEDGMITLVPSLSVDDISEASKSISDFTDEGSGGYETDTSIVSEMTSEFSALSSEIPVSTQTSGSEGTSESSGISSDLSSISETTEELSSSGSSELVSEASVATSEKSSDETIISSYGSSDFTSDSVEGISGSSDIMLSDGTTISGTEEGSGSTSSEDISSDYAGSSESDTTTASSGDDTKETTITSSNSDLTSESEITTESTSTSDSTDLSSSSSSSESTSESSESTSESSESTSESSESTSISSSSSISSISDMTTVSSDSSESSTQSSSEDNLTTLAEKTSSTEEDEEGEPEGEIVPGKMKEEDSSESTTPGEGDTSEMELSSGSGSTESSKESSITESSITEETSSFSQSSEMSSESFESTMSSITTEKDSSESLSTELSGSSEFTTELGLTATAATDTSMSSSFEDVWGKSLSTLQAAIAKEQKGKKCKPRKKPKVDCSKLTYGCCSDNRTPAKGPFSKGCPQPQTCNETKHGCCPDGVSPAYGANFDGCPDSHCNETLFGCCPDGISIAEGNENEGCPKPKEKAKNCEETEFGCCPDGKKEAEGPSYMGCFECEGSGPCESCNDTKYGCCPDSDRPATGDNYDGCDIEGSGEIMSSTFEPDELEPECFNSTFGCCPDNITAARGENQEGCDADCSSSQFGCCRDGVSPAHGPNQEGCCLTSPYGCCPDNIQPARGLNYHDCGCQYSPYGCCPDNVTAAKGYDNDGCACQYTKYGCCPNRHDVAQGPDFEGCPCHTFQFGCCTDGITKATGPNNRGCTCQDFPNGCCSDEKTPAPGPNKEGCTCDHSKYGCCLDGTTEALGDKFEGCAELPDIGGEVCALEKDRGTCRDYVVRWYYDTEYGGCTRFWYGNCQGNKNNFNSQEECQAKCVNPPGREVCLLPKSSGACNRYNPAWYYDSARKQCGQFIYGGCLGNQNRFETREDCEKLCVVPDKLDACEQEKQEGPCQGNYIRWFFDKESKTCQQFRYGGCKGNDNNFPSENACLYRCRQPGKSLVTDVCTFPMDTGPCQGAIRRWHFNTEKQQCMPFLYGGCKGNGNRFRTLHECNEHCLKLQDTREMCKLPKQEGAACDASPLQAAWAFDVTENRCLPFYYTGCEGNENRFDTREVCEESCPAKYERDLCTLPAISGDCQNYTLRWYYDASELRCREFYYGGCGGNHNNFPTDQHCKQRCESDYEPPQPIDEFKTEHCFLQSDHGPCTETLAKWYYDSREGVCKQFIYGGCHGNMNRFETELECQQRCEHTQDICDLPPVPGPCENQVIQWYYNRERDTCLQFYYGGCQGNGNRFDDQHRCEQRCLRRVPQPEPEPQPPVYEQPPQPEPAQTYPEPLDICNLPAEPGPCQANKVLWFYDPNSQNCNAFVYGGCEGNANRFDSEEQCERQCGSFRGQDVCGLPVNPGTCNNKISKWYYDVYQSGCREFHYSGCEGNANRFSTQHECESICLHRAESLPSGNETGLTEKAICRLPVDPGPCSETLRRWYFDEQARTCRSFIYTGCAGNMNRFKNFDTCIGYCTVLLEGNNPAPNEIPVDSPLDKLDPDECMFAKEHCQLLQCPYGVERYVDEHNCERCQCHNPCHNVVCPPGQQCTIDFIKNLVTRESELQTNCRHITKPGDCPQLAQAIDTSHCDKECNTDADCGGDSKCCSNGCGTSCVSPRIIHEDKRPHRQGVPPQIVSTEPENMEVSEGYYAILPCKAEGDPKPTVSWRKHNNPIGEQLGTYKLLADGSLQVIGAQKEDTGTFTCIADNGIDPPAQRKYNLQVTDSEERKADIVGDSGLEVVANLNGATVLHCYAYGFPRPAVTWWRGDTMVPLENELYDQKIDHALHIRRVSIQTLGPYTCQAYNGVGKPASWVVVLQALAPEYFESVDPEFDKYLIRPAPAPAPEFVAPPQANLTSNLTQYSVGNDIELKCNVQGEPTPDIRWFKDNEPLEPSDRITFLETTRVVILRSSPDDGGRYRCEATNNYGSSMSDLDISVEGVFVPADCTDNQFFANCQLIVRARYCRHKYYAKFCCKSCTLAGQLSPETLQMDDPGLNSVY